MHCLKGVTIRIFFWFVFLRIQIEYGKNGAEKAPSSGPFYAAILAIFRKFLNPEAVVERCSVKKVFLETSQHSQENTCARVSFLIKLQASALQIY